MKHNDKSLLKETMKNCSKFMNDRFRYFIDKNVVLISGVKVVKCHENKKNNKIN